MRCGILMTNCYLILLSVALMIGCASKKDKIYVYKYYDMYKGPMKKTDTIIVKQLPGYKDIVIKNNGKDTVVSVKYKEGIVEILKKKQFNTFYTAYNDSTYLFLENINVDANYFTPLLAAVTQFETAREFNVDNKFVKVYKFWAKGKDNSTYASYTYYTREYGFICYQDFFNNIYKLLITTSDRQKDEALHKLTKEVMRDSEFVAYPTIILPPPEIIMDK